MQRYFNMTHNRHVVADGRLNVRGRSHFKKGTTWDKS